MRRLVALSSLLCTLAAPSVAGAFCRTTTVPVAADFSPTRERCWTNGFPLFWRNSCVSYSIQKLASRQVAYDDAANAFSRAFTKWTGSTCPSENVGRSRVSIDVRDLGPVECPEVDYNQSGGNQNVIVFRDDKWPHGDTANTLALTTVTFNPNTGEIYDADMEINTKERKVTLVDPVPKDGYDFESIVTHEAGHFLGLAHSGDSLAAMYANYVPGATAMRNLTSDDVAGICSIYRPDGTRVVLDEKITKGPSCDPTPRHGFIRECAAPKTSGCLGNTVAPAGTHAHWGVVGAALVLSGLRRRRRRT